MQGYPEEKASQARQEHAGKSHRDKYRAVPLGAHLLRVPASRANHVTLRRC